VIKKFEEIEHTADIALQVWGKNLEELFSNAAAGMYSLIHKDINIHGLDEWEFSVSDQSAENLLVIFLNELYYYISIKKTIVCKPIEIKITQDTGIYELTSKARSQKIPQNIFEELVEIKAVTYHNLNIIKDDNALKTIIIFDI